MKPDKVVFVDEELEKCFNELPESDLIKKAIIRVIGSIKENA
jgi:hypothetical protein